MKRLVILTLVGVFVYGAAIAANTDSHAVSFQILAINELDITGSPTLVITTATPGGEPASVSDNTSRLSFTTNQASRRITAALDSDMPADTTLEVNVSGLTGTWSSTGLQTLSSTAVNVATGNRGAQNNRTVTYTFSATSAAGELTGSRTVTYTLTSNP